MSAQIQNAPQNSEKKSNFFLGFIFLPKLKRQALSAVYAYCRAIDDIVDAGDKTERDARESLDFWRNEIENIYAGKGELPLSKELEKALLNFPLPKEAFYEMIRGCEMDLEKKCYRTFEELEPYLQGVAVSAGKLTVEILGHDYTPKAGMDQFVKSFGYAFQMTNILRDVGADIEMGRVYLPEDAMQEAGYSRKALLRREQSPAFKRLMGQLHEKTKGFYRTGRSALDSRDRKKMFPAEVMAHIYEGVLDEIKRNDFHVFFSKTSLSPLRKFSLAFKAWLYCHGL
jgi:phytoene synthase